MPNADKAHLDLFRYFVADTIPQQLAACRVHASNPLDKVLSILFAEFRAIVRVRVCAVRLPIRVRGLEVCDVPDRAFRRLLRVAAVTFSGIPVCLRDVGRRNQSGGKRRGGWGGTLKGLGRQAASQRGRGDWDGAGVGWAVVVGEWTS